ncbi:hypothetical protein GC584_09410 [Corynebacterium sp. zg912]|uniref:Uncharacterized protein n=1 Tax=Corynebacterium wankanglinii TaxID=2735136 RepID=A0A7V9A2W0_9CORY|nr:MULTISPECIES: hypothetical protein [Corynebacterium]MBA1838267.1 hypothetical protein [Corynebacterium wankanglinii]MCR5929619.1 hypothetical protein [Corynebacterium sp. zg912]
MRRAIVTAVAVAVTAVLAGCAPEAQLSPLERAKSVNQSKHVAQLFADRPEVVDDVLGIKTTRLFFPASETLVLSDATVEAQLRAASIAVATNAPMMVYDPGRHAEYARMIADMHTVTVLTVGDVSIAPSSGAVRVRRDPGGLRALEEMTALRFVERTVDEPGDAVREVASLDQREPTWIRAAWADPVVLPAAKPEPLPIQSRRDANMAPRVVATWESSIPSVANARSYGATVSVVPLPDPRKSEETLFAMAGLSDLPLVALGSQFGTSEVLAHRIRQAEAAY